MKQDMVCVIYLDDTIIASPYSVAIEELITNLVLRKMNKTIHLNFEVRVRLVIFWVSVSETDFKKLLFPSMSLSIKS